MSTPEAPDQGIDGAFIETHSSELSRTQQKKRGGPYTKSQRRKRRAEVYRLHFELGMPAIRIAEALKVDRNTINQDLKLLYAEAARKWHNDLTISELINIQLLRLASQRDRLSSYLEKAKNDMELTLSIERQITNVDCQLTAILERLDYAPAKFWETLIKQVNKMAERNGLDMRFTSLFELMNISEETRQRFDKLVEMSRKGKVVKEEEEEPQTV